MNGLLKGLVFGAVVAWIAVFQGSDAEPTAQGMDVQQH